MQNKNIVILGGGVGGIVTANHLAELLPPEIQILLIERNKPHSFPASYLWLMVNKRKPGQITAQLRDLVYKRVTILYEEVKEIDAANKIIIAGETKVNFDYLVVALGADLDKTHLDKQEFGIHTFFTLEGAEKLSKALESCEGGNVSIAVSSLPYKCPGAPYEGAMLIADYLNKRKLKKPVSVNLYTPAFGSFIGLSGAHLPGIVIEFTSPIANMFRDFVSNVSLSTDIQPDSSESVDFKITSGVLCDGIKTNKS